MTPALEKQICDSLNSREFATRNICIVKMFLPLWDRPPEICDLKLEDVELNNIRVTDAKGDIRPSRSTQKQRKHWTNIWDAVFTPVDGKTLSS